MNPINPHDWLIKAERDLRAANDLNLHSTDVPDVICYHCQQAVEKFLKSLIIHYKQPFRRTHDVEELLDLLSVIDKTIDSEFYVEALKVKNYSVDIRYPEPEPDPSPDKIAEALAAATFFQNYARRALGLQ